MVFFNEESQQKIERMLLLAQGRTAEIYLWDESHVLKLFRDWCPSDWVEYEARIASAVYAAGIPSPAPGDIIEVNGRRGLIYERLDGISMLQDLNARPWRLFRHARALAELQVQIHRQTITGLPSYKDRLSYDIRNTSQLSDEIKNQVFVLLEDLPEGQNLCHGDFHPGNVFIAERGPVVIDWMTACAGVTAADVARTGLLLNIGAKTAAKQVHPLIQMMIGLYHRTYLNRYHTLIPDIENEIDRWTPVIAAARLNENIAPEREALIKMARGS